METDNPLFMFLLLELFTATASSRLSSVWVMEVSVGMVICLASESRSPRSPQPVSSRESYRTSLVPVHHRLRIPPKCDSCSNQKGGRWQIRSRLQTCLEPMQVEAHLSYLD